MSLYIKTEVNSSFIKTIIWDQKNSKLLLNLKIKEGQYQGVNTYMYPDISFDTYQDLLKSKSKGKFFHQYLKNEKSVRLEN